MAHIMEHYVAVIFKHEDKFSGESTPRNGCVTGTQREKVIAEAIRIRDRWVRESTTRGYDPGPAPDFKIYLGKLTQEVSLRPRIEWTVTDIEDDV